MTSILSDRFTDALAYATRIHAGQTRKGGDIPYISHLLAVTALVLEDGGDEDQAIAALLHDAAEDQGGRERLDDIRERFGPRVASIVEGCSDTLESSKPPWHERKPAYLAHLRTASPDVLRVSCADKLHNTRAILADHRLLGDGLWPRFNAPVADILWYHSTLVDVFRERHPGPLTEELARTVSELASRVRGPAPETPAPAPPPHSATETFFERLVEPPPGPPSMMERLFFGRKKR